MHPNAQLIHDLYTAFQQRDGEAMARFYHAEARFSDPVFPALQGDEPGWMWRMLCAQGADLEVEFSDVQADDDQGSATWQARYSFGPAKRPVHNQIQATFRFRDGAIVEHHDRFDLYRWARQALGPTGWLLGWAPPVHNKVRAQAARQLERYIAKHRD